METEDLSDTLIMLLVVAEVILPLRRVKVAETEQQIQ